MTFGIRFKTSNAAFEDDPTPEIARILESVASRVREDAVTQGRVMDINGNWVGDFFLYEEVGDEDETLE
jgi:hypothetical protein